MSNVLTQRLGLQYPIVQAPMNATTLADMVVAVASRGGLGSLGSATMTPQQVRDQVGAIRARTDRPFALNFFVHDTPKLDQSRAAEWQVRTAKYRAELSVQGEATFAPPPPPFDAAMLECVLALKPAAVSFHFGLPSEPMLSALKQAGIFIASSATHVDEAVLLERAGVDAVIAQGTEAGGHRGTFAVHHDQAQVGLFALVPAIVRAVRVPVIAAGGIADGRGIAAALQLGASAAQLGTAFLACPEAVIDPLYRRMLQDPRARFTRVTRLLSGRPARAIVTRYLDELAAYELETLEFPLQRAFVAQLGKAGAARGDAEFSAMWCGQNPKLRPMPAGELFELLLREADLA